MTLSFSIAWPILVFHIVVPYSDAFTVSPNPLTTVPGINNLQQTSSPFPFLNQELLVDTTLQSNLFLLCMDGGEFDTLRNITLLLVGLLVVAVAGTAFVTQSVIPDQMDKLAQLVAKENPEAFRKITQELEEGQSIRQRPDLMSKLVEAGVDLMKEESTQEMETLRQLVQQELAKENCDDSEGWKQLQKPIETTLGMTIDEFIAKVEKNKDSEYLTETAKDLASLLKRQRGKILGKTFSAEE